MKLWIIGCVLAVFAVPSMAAQNSAPQWAWVAAVSQKDQEAATMAVARAHIPAVLEGSHAVGFFVHPADKARAIAVLKADARRGHYAVDFGGTRPRTKKPSH